MTQTELIDAMAQLWVENGGDADGIDWCHGLIKEAVRELMARQVEEEA